MHSLMPSTLFDGNPTRSTVYSLSFLAFVTWFTYIAVTPTLAVQMLDNKSPTWLLGVLATIAGLTGTMMGAPLGIFGDRTSLGKLVSIGTVLRIIPFGMLILLPLTPTVSILAVAMFGLLNPFVFLLGYLWISRNSDLRGADIGTFSAAPWVASIFGPLFGMYVISHLGFRWLCIIGAILSLMLFPIGLKIKDRVPKKAPAISVFKEHRAFVAFYLLISILVDATVFFYAPYWMYIGHNLGADESMIRIASSVVSLAVALSIKVSGNLCDSIGRSKVTLVGYLVMGIMVPLMPFAGSFSLLVLIYSLAKFSECFAETGISVLLSDAPDEMRGSLTAATGWISAGAGVGFASLSGAMIDRYGVFPSYAISTALIATMIAVYFYGRPKIAKSLVKSSLD